MVSGRERRKALARAKWERQQARRTAAQRRARRLGIIGGAALAVVAAGGIGYGGYALVSHVNGNSPSKPQYTDNFPTLLQPPTPGITAFSYSPGTGQSTGSSSTAGTPKAPTTPTAPVSTGSGSQ